MTDRFGRAGLELGAGGGEAGWQLVARLSPTPVVTSETEAKRAADATVARFGRIDVLVNYAGYSLLGNFEEFTTEQIERESAEGGPRRLLDLGVPVDRGLSAPQRWSSCLTISTSTAGSLPGWRSTA